jgi:hypothetical protein
VLQRDIASARNSPRVSLGLVDDVPAPAGFRESQIEKSFATVARKSVVAQGDPAGVRAMMASESILDGLGASPSFSYSSVSNNSNIFTKSFRAGAEPYAF